jgi:acid phosphatase (class A)
MVPELQDTILHRAYQYSESRVIVGAHYQSDVDAGRLAASAAFARLHTSPYYLADLKAARKEFDKFRKFENVDASAMPHCEKFLGEPVDTISRRFYGDVVQYWQAKAERGTERGRQAIADADCSDAALMKSFAPLLGTELSGKSTPAMAALFSAAKSALLENTNRLKDINFRKRPFVQFGEPSLLPDTDADAALTSSYPAEQSAIGWGMALLLVEIAPENQNAILTRGYEYGRSCVITGRNYASDVQASRLMAAAVVAHLHTNPDFVNLVEKAKAEYLKKRKK